MTAKSTAATKTPGPNTKIMRAQSEFAINTRVKFKYRRGLIFHGLVKERLPTGLIKVQYESSKDPKVKYEAVVKPFILKAV